MTVRKGFSLKLLSAEADSSRGRFEGTALPYGVRDTAGDQIREGCFSRSITHAEGRFPLLWSHHAEDVLGSVQVVHDSAAMKVHGSMLIEHIPKARQVFELLRSGSIKGLSIGFWPIKAAPIEGGGTEFVEGRLLEVSLVACPMYVDAAVSEVRSIRELIDTLHSNQDREALIVLRGTIDEILESMPAPVVKPQPNAEAEELARILNGIKVPAWSYRRG